MLPFQLKAPPLPRIGLPAVRSRSESCSAAGGPLSGVDSGDEVADLGVHVCEA